MLKAFFLGVRPKTLVAALLPPLVAAAYIYFLGLEVNYFILICCIGLALFIQMATNFYNDAVDFKKGADSDRVGPKRISSENSLGQVFWFGHFCLIISVIFGVPLILEGGILFILIGLISLFLAYGYTGGPFPLAYLGLGELFVYLFFGLVATMGSAFLIAGVVSIHLFLIGSIIGLLSTVLIAINNFRDSEKDILVGKRTLATRMSKRKYLRLIDFCLFGPYFILLYFLCFIDLKFIFPILAAGLAHRIRHDLREVRELSSLNETLTLGGKHLFFFGGLFILSCIVK